MKLSSQKRIAGIVLNRSPKRIRFDAGRLEEIKESITKSDIRNLVSSGAIIGLQKKGVSRSRAKKIATQRKKGRRRGHGSRKGTENARLSTKDKWIAKVRKQRLLLKTLKASKKLTQKDFEDLYYKSKGGFFRSIRHLKLYINENSMVQK